jgi:hypothetical protein
VRGKRRGGPVGGKWAVGAGRPSGKEKRADDRLGWRGKKKRKGRRGMVGCGVIRRKS